MRTSFFESPEADQELEELNTEFWDALIGQIRMDFRSKAPDSILDVGCHHGGLLEKLVRSFKPAAPQRIFGIEPIEAARLRARLRLKGAAFSLTILSEKGWEEIPSNSIELVTCHEVLYLHRDLNVYMTQLERVLSASGRAYVVLGCHPENPVWEHWKPRLQAMGHSVYDHRPMDILTAASNHGLQSAVRPLRPAGWITYDPLQTEFPFPSVGEMVDHHFKHKLLFRFIKR